MFRRIFFLCQKCKHLSLSRGLNLHEYQSKNILRQNGCIVQNFFVAGDSVEAKAKLSKHSMFLKNFKSEKKILL